MHGRTGAATIGKRGVVTEQEWGRVDADGTVWVRTAAGERSVGQYPGATETEALAYFTRKYEDLKAQVDLLEQRLKAGQVSPADAEQTIRRLAATIPAANAVGDLDGLTARLEALSPLAEQRRTSLEKARAEARERSLTARQVLVEEAEQIAATDSATIVWKTAGDRLRELFETWRTMQRDSRLDRHTEDELWKRFSHARTTFDRRRRQHFSALDEQRAEAKATKEKLVLQAEELADSTEWGATAAAYRGLMEQWKGAGRAARKDDDALWARFRTAQERFFTARTEASAQTDSEYRTNLEAKEALLVEAEALLPVTDVPAARNALRDLQERWEAVGRVPRTELTRVEGRLRKVEQAVREAEDQQWVRSNPEARARASAAVAQLEQAIATLTVTLEKAKASGDARRIRDAEATLEARKEWLVEARRALSDFGG